METYWDSVRLELERSERAFDAGDFGLALQSALNAQEMAALLASWLYAKREEGRVPGTGRI